MNKFIKYLLIIFFLLFQSACSSESKCTEILAQMDEINISNEGNPVSLLEGTVNLFKASRGCADFYCGEEKWNFSEVENGCEIILEINVNGMIEIAPMYYVNFENKNIYPISNPANFNTPQLEFKYELIPTGIP